MRRRIVRPVSRPTAVRSSYAGSGDQAKLYHKEESPTFSFNDGLKLVMREAGHTLKAGKSLHTPTVLLAALFFELEWDATTALLLSGGGRYSHNRNSFVPDTRNLLLPGMADHWTLLLALVLLLLDMLVLPLLLLSMFYLVSCHVVVLFDCLVEGKTKTGNLNTQLSSGRQLQTLLYYI